MIFTSRHFTFLPLCSLLFAGAAYGQISVIDLSSQNGSPLARGAQIQLGGDEIADFEIAQPTVVGGLNFLGSTQFFGDSATGGDFFANSGEGWENPRQSERPADRREFQAPS